MMATGISFILKKYMQSLNTCVNVTSLTLLHVSNSHIASVIGGHPFSYRATAFIVTTGALFQTNQKAREL